MREFRYVSGGSSKFWRIGRDGSVVTVWFGPLGENGRHQARDLGRDDAAIAFVDRQAAAKLKAGYAEVVPSVPGSGPVRVAGVVSGSGGRPRTAGKLKLPNEDKLAYPAGWRRDMHPRRGGVPVVARRREGRAGDIERRSHFTRQTWDERGSDREVAAAGRRYLTGDPTPLGAASAAAASRTGNPGVADGWVASEGLVFAAQACAELATLAYTDKDALVRYGPDTGPYYSGWIPATASITQLRGYLAECSDDEHAAVYRALVPYRAGSLRLRTVLSYLLPDRTDWVDEDSAAGGGWLLVYSLRTPQQVDAYAHARDKDSPRTAGDLATVLEGVGPAGAGAIVRWHERWARAEDRDKMLVQFLSAVPTDEAFTLLLDRLDRAGAPAALGKAAKRYPVRALRLLAARCATAPVDGVVEALREHVAAVPDLVEVCLPDLPEADRALVASLVGSCQG